MVRFIKKLISRKPKGSIAYYGLSEWWMDSFTDEERREIIERFEPMGASSGLIEGEILESSQSCLRFLDVLAGWFEKPEHRHIGYKILAKANGLVGASSSVLDRHFHFQAQIQLYYRNRDEDPDALDHAIDACIRQIQLAPEAMQASESEYGDHPEHKGYKQLAIILEKRGEYDDAIEICKRAASQGWTGDWEKRIARCRKRVDSGT